MSAAEDQNIFLIIRDDIKNVSVQVQEVDDGVKTSNSSLATIQTSINGMPFESLLNEVDNVQSAIQETNNKVDSGVASLKTQFTSKIDGISTKLDTGAQTASAQLTNFQKETNAKIDGINSNIGTLTAQLTAFQNSTKASLDNLTALVNAIIKILKPLGVI
jgi:chromosome segregation ATPase